jgi:hypothetical protein
MIVMVGISATSASAVIPLQTEPVWESVSSGHYATGGEWIDVDRDGWLDMVVANGNDMERQRLVIYHNNGNGTLPAQPTWEAEDLDYHGHLDIGDINGDLLPDVATAVYIGESGFGEPGYVKVYLNDGFGAFSATPDWISDERFFSFSVSLGDADGDGDLDLACACGEDYFNNPEQQRVFFNEGGALETESAWRSEEIGYALDVAWSDLDCDGDLDLLFCGSSTPMRAYRNNQTDGGGIESSAWWESTDLPQFGNTVASGDINGDDFPDIAVADNNQLGGEGRFKAYRNNSGIVDTEPSWESSSGGYGSHVSWIDLDLDGDLDLAAGRWWSWCRIFLNNDGDLTPTPIWQSTTTSVIENMFWGDVDNDGLRRDGTTVACGDSVRSLFLLDRRPVRSVDRVTVDDSTISPTQYAVDLQDGWISFAAPPPEGDGNVSIRYAYSEDIDLGVTNWDPGIGNYLFLNEAASGLFYPGSSAVVLTAYPNPMKRETTVFLTGTELTAFPLRIYDMSGRLVNILDKQVGRGGFVRWQWDRCNSQGRPVADGTYFAMLILGDHTQTARLIVAR